MQKYLKNKERSLSSAS